MADPKAYPVVGPGAQLPPDHARVARALTDAELEEEILARRGGRDYQLALLSELDRRGHTPPPETSRPPAYDADEWDD